MVVTNQGDYIIRPKIRQNIKHTPFFNVDGIESTIKQSFRVSCLSTFLLFSSFKVVNFEPLSRLHVTMQKRLYQKPYAIAT